MKLLRIAILILILASRGAFCVFGQQGTTDSIKSALKTRLNDSARVQLLIALAASYEPNHKDSMLLPSRKALAIAEQDGYERGVMNSLTELAIAYGYLYQFDSSLRFHTRALQIAKRLHDKGKIATLTMNLGEDHFSLYEYAASLPYIDSAMQLYQALHDTLGMAKCLANLSTIYYASGDYPEGVEEGLKAIQYYDAIHYKNDLPVCYTNIGSIYAELGDYKKALDYHEKNLAISKQLQNNDAVEAALNNIGYTYHEMKNYDKALEYYKATYDMAAKLDDYDSKNIALLNIANIYLDIGNYKKALPYFEDCLKEGTRLNNTETIVVCQVCIAKVLQMTHGDINEAIAHLKEGYNISTAIKSKLLIQKCAKNLAEAYEQKKDYISALKYYKIYHDYSDSLYNDKNNKRIQQLQFNYEIANKENKINKLERDNVLVKTNNERQKLISIGLSLGLTLFALFIGLLYRNQRKLSRSNKLINEQKAAIEQQTADLKDLNTFKDKILSVMSHDLRSPIASINSFIEILDYNELKEDEFQELRDTMHNQIESVMLLVDNLLHWASNSFRGKEAGLAEVLDMYEISQLSIALLQNIAKAKDIRIVNEIPRGTKGYGNYEQIDIVIRNLIANAIKFIPLQGKITVSGISYQNIVAVSIADTGVGMSDQQMSTLFTKSQTSTYGTGGEKGVGLGLLLCKEFIELNGGTISVMSELNKGTVFTITLPKPPEASAAKA